MSFIEQLYNNIVGGGTTFDGLSGGRLSEEEAELGDRFDKLLKENNITGDRYNAIWDAMSDFNSYCECDGFKNGFILGAKFMLEVTFIK